MSRLNEIFLYLYLIYHIANTIVIVSSCVFQMCFVFKILYFVFCICILLRPQPSKRLPSVLTPDNEDTIRQADFHGDDYDYCHDDNDDDEKDGSGSKEDNEPLNSPML